MSNKVSNAKKNASAAANKARGKSSDSPLDKATAWLKNLWAKVSKR